ncbi:MAG: hydroxylamine reductase, partial [Syntrophaceae bacterium]|nr:hydroxylamine reductase [Syntrophaceae bacterium]
MFCYQCEQTLKGEGCVKAGVCGKQPDVAALQDLLIYAIRGLAQVAIEARKAGIVDGEVNVFTIRALFATLTNVNFDRERFIGLINECVEQRERLRGQMTARGLAVRDVYGPVGFRPEATPEGLIHQGEAVGLHIHPDLDPDILSLQQIVTFGIKGIAAYADHARILGREDDAVYAFCQEGLAATLRKDIDLNGWVELVLKCGEVNLRVMELLDAAHTGRYGHPVPTRVPLGAKQGKAILVS